MSWNILCIKCINGNVSPLAKTKREISAKDQRRLVRKFRYDHDFDGSVLMPISRLRMTEQEIKSLPTI